METKFLAEAFAGAAEGLHHAHQQKIIHRDIKPSNLILDRNGRMRILDFGLARAEGQGTLTRSGEFLGTPLYMSPEQARARRAALDHRTDIYSLGATMYETLAHRPPFRGRDHRDTISQILTRYPEPLRKIDPGIPRDLETIVLKCLEKEPDRRYATAEALAQDLRRFARGDPIEARPQTALETLLRRARRHRPAIAAALAAAAILLTSGLLFSRYLEDRRLARERIYVEKVKEAALLIPLGESIAITRRQAPAKKAGEAGSVAYASELEPLAGGESDPLEGALELLAEAARLVPEKPETYYHWARALALQGRHAEALKILDRALRRGSPFVPAVIWKAVRYGKEGGFPAGGGLAAAPGTGSAWEGAYRLVHEAKNRRDWKAADRACSALIASMAAEEEPYIGARVEARLERGLLNLRLGDIDGALIDFAAAETLEPQAIEPALLLGKALYLRGNAEAAEAKFTELFASAKQKDAAAYWISIFYSQFERFGQSLFWADRIQEELPREISRCLPLTKLGRSEEALGAAEKAVQLNPDDSRAHTSLANALASRGRDEESLREHELSARMAPKAPVAHSNLGWIYTKLGRLEQGIAACQEALKIDPDCAHAYRILGVCCRRMNRLEESRAALERCAALEPHVAGAHYELGVVLEKMWRLGEAARAYERAGELDPGRVEPFYNLGNVRREEGKYDLAIAAFKRALALKDEQWFHNNLGEVCLLAEQIDQAVEHLDQASRMDPEDPEPLEILARCFDRRGDLEKAQALRLKSLALRHEQARKTQGKPPDLLAYELITHARFLLAPELGERRDPRTALEYAKRAGELGATPDPRALDTLAEAFFANGDISQAIQAAERALALLPASEPERESWPVWKQLQGRLESLRQQPAGR